MKNHHIDSFSVANNQLPVYLTEHTMQYESIKGSFNTSSFNTGKDCKVISCRKRRMVKNGDYEIKTGAYFGAGLPIYHIIYETPQGDERDINIRAQSNSQAREIFKAERFV
jgi:hypothetical protein